MKTLVESHIRTIVKRVAPMVQSVTGYELDLDHLVIWPVHRHHFTSIVENAYRGVQVSFEAGTFSRRFNKKVASLHFRNSILGLYDPLSSTIYIDKSLTDEVLSDVIGHELVHRGQHVTFPGFHQYHAEKIRKAYSGRNMYDFNGVPNEDLIETRILSSFVEWDAYSSLRIIESLLRGSFNHRLPLRAHLVNLLFMPFTHKDSEMEAQWDNKFSSRQDRLAIFNNPHLAKEIFEGRKLSSASSAHQIFK